MNSFDASSVIQRVKERGFAFCPGLQIGRVINTVCSSDATSFFADSWNHLGVDKFLADGGDIGDGVLEFSRPAVMRSLRNLINLTFRVEIIIQ